MELLRDLPVCVQQEHLLLSREYFRRRGISLGPSSIPSVLQLMGPLDYEVAERALNEIVKRHSALPTEFTEADDISHAERNAEIDSFAKCGVFRPGLYRQSIQAEAPIGFRIVDLSSVTPANRDVELRRTIALESSMEFNYRRPPLLRAALIRMEPAEHLLVLTVDHLVSDAWSMRMLRREFSHLYSRFQGGQPHSLEEPAFSFADYAVYQERAARLGAFDLAMAYWGRQWAAFGAARVAFGDFLFASSSPSSPSYTFASEVVSFPRATSQAIRMFARLSRVTLYAFFLAAYTRLLHRLTGRTLLGIWGHFANRMKPESHHLCGWLATTHLIGLDLTSNPTFSSLMQQARRTILAGAEHQELPVALLWRNMGGYPRHPDAKVLLDVSSAEQIEYGVDRELKIVHAPHLTPSFGRFSNLGLYIRDTADEIQVTAQYSEDRFKQCAVRSLLTDFQTVVLTALDHPDSQVTQS